MTPLPLWVKRRRAKSEYLPTQKKLFYAHRNNVVLDLLNCKRPGTELSIYGGGERGRRAAGGDERQFLGGGWLPAHGEALRGRVAAVLRADEDGPGTSRHRARLRQATQDVGQEVERLLRQRSAANGSIYLFISRTVTCNIHSEFTTQQAGQTGGCNALKLMSALNLD